MILFRLPQQQSVQKKSSDVAHMSETAQSPLVESPTCSTLFSIPPLQHPHAVTQPGR